MPLLEKRTPFGELDLIDRRMRCMFAGLGIAPVIVPAADIYETDEKLIVELEVPGFDEKELDIQVVDHTLTVKGERKEEKATQEAAVRLRERLETSFERSFILPSEADSEHLTAVYAKGLLTLQVPKTPRLKPRKIAIASK